MSDRPCTCHPDDNPSIPCPQKYALSECKAAQSETVADTTMTAKLPPLPKWDEEPDDIRAQMQSYALQAVRDALERAAVSAWTAGMDEHNKARGMPCDAREVGSQCAKAVRALLKEYE